MSKEFLLPHNTDAEKCVLGAMLIAPEAVTDYALETLRAEQFYHPKHQVVFEAIKSLTLIGMSVDFTTLTGYLVSRRQLDEIGGRAAVSELYTATPTAANVKQHTELVVEQARLRALYSLSSRVLTTIRDGKPNSEELVNRIAVEMASIDPSANGEHVLPVVVEKVKAKLARARSGGGVSGQKTEFLWWDHYFGGLVEGSYYGLAARPMLGKSALMEQMVGNLLNRNIPVCIFAQDMAPDMLIERMACRLAEVSKWSLDHGRCTGDEIDLVESIVDTLSKSPLRLHCIERMTGEMLVSVARRELRKHKVQHFFLDHVQTIHVPSGHDEREAWAAASLLVRRFVTSNPVSWVSIAHLNREAAKERAAGHQIRGFDNLLGDVDGLVLLDTGTDPSDLKPGEDWPMSFIVAKNRNGPAGDKPVLFERGTMKFVPDNIH